jgi:hypothetical protein
MLAIIVIGACANDLAASVLTPCITDIGLIFNPDLIVLAMRSPLPQAALGAVLAS